MDKLHNLRWDVLKEDVLVWCVTHQPFHAWQQPVPSRLTTTPAGLLHHLVHTERATHRCWVPGCGGEHSAKAWPCAWPRDLHELTPLYDQRAHTTLRTASSHHSMTSKLTSLYKQRAHTIL
ncbi:hypothetical protein EMCRGX_G028167 [Ephydatia muelleri]